MKKRIMCLTLAFLLIFSTQALAFRMDSYDRTLKIGLKSMQATLITVTFNGDYMCGGELYKTGTSLNIQLLNSKLNINGNEYDELQFNPLNTSSTITLQAGNSKYSYLGSMIFKLGSKGIIPINLIRVDDYLKGLVPFEMSNSYPIEALKAQAVAARNYALTNIGKHSSLGYDLCDGDDCQMYRGYNPSYGRANTAVDETKGVLLLYNGSLVTCYYSSRNGGYTEDPVNPWYSSVPYLIVEKDDFDNEAWPGGDVKLTTLQIDGKLKTKGIISKDDTFVRIDIGSIQRYQGVRISKLNIVVKGINGVERTVEIKKGAVSSFLSLQSTYYYISYDNSNDTYTFTGKGYGHGIGMSQIGARNRANAGWKYDEILKFYYHGSYAASVDGVTIALSQDKNMIMAGDEVKFDAVTSGSTSNKLYKYVVTLGNSIIYTRDYSSDASFTYKSEKSGNYNVSLYVKAADSSNQYDDLKNTSFSVFEAPVLGEIKILTSNPCVNKPVSVSASVKGGSGAGLKCTVDVMMDGKVIETKETEGLSYTFTPKIVGQYVLGMNIKDTMSSKNLDDSKEIKIDVKQQSIFNYTRILKKGMSGSDVKTVQDLLARLKLFTGKSTGYFGSATVTSVKNFQKSVKLSQTGVVDARTADALNSKFISNTSVTKTTTVVSKPSTSTVTVSSSKIVYAPKRTLKLGMTGSDVKTLQDLLARLKQYKTKSTGYFGSVTAASVKSFQKSVGLSQTGIVDQKTVNAINGKFSSNTSKTAVITVSTSKPLAAKIVSSSSKIVYAPKRNLNVGMSGSDVKTLQDLLARLKQYKTKSTGYFGSVTATSVRSFQKSVGLKQTGIVDSAVVKMINVQINR